MNYKAHERFAKIVMAVSIIMNITLLTWAYINWP